MASTQRRLLAELDGQIRDLEERIYYRDMAAAAGGAVDATDAASEKALHAELVEFRHRHPNPEPDQDDAEPASGTLPSAPEPSAPSLAARPSRFQLVETAIDETLTPSELLHWQELQKGTKQTAIAGKLGISQGAVSKRERALRERLDAISVETIGRPYPERLIDRGKWARQGRRRNKSAPRQR